MAESDNPLEELTPPAVQPVLEHTAQAGTLTTEALEAALTLHGEKMVQHLREALREATLENAGAVAEAIRKELEALETVAEETVPAVTGENGSTNGETHLELESAPAVEMKVKRHPALMRAGRRR